MNTPTATTDTTKTEEIRLGSIETVYDGQVGLMVEGLASVFNEPDYDGDFTTGMAFKALRDEWAQPADRRLLFEHGTDPKLGHRRIGTVIDHDLTSKGLLVKSFVPRDPPYHDKDARVRYREVYNGIKGGKITGYSVQGNFVTDRRGEVYECSVGELSICRSQAGRSATFQIMNHGIKAAVDKALLKRAQQDHDQPLHDYILKSMEPGVKHVPDQCRVCLMRNLDVKQTVERVQALLDMDDQRG